MENSQITTMLTFTIPAFVLILFAIVLAGTAAGMWMTLTYTVPKD